MKSRIMNFHGSGYHILQLFDDVVTYVEISYFEMTYHEI